MPTGPAAKMAVLQSAVVSIFPQNRGFQQRS
jgi:hypothetical protein